MHGRHDVRDTDIELVRNAMYVEPKDQSAWVYYDWLMLHLCLLFPSPSLHQQCLHMLANSQWNA